MRPGTRMWTLDNGKSVPAKFNDIQGHYVIVKDEFFSYRKIDFFTMSKAERIAAVKDAQIQSRYLNETKGKALYQRVMAAIKAYGEYSGQTDKQEEGGAALKAKRIQEFERDEAEYRAREQERKVRDMQSKIDSMESEMRRNGIRSW